GTFGPLRSVTTGRNPTVLLPADVNGDGVMDLITANPGFSQDPLEGQLDPSGLSVLLGNGDGSYQPARTVTTSSVPVALGAAGVDGGGRLDLLPATPPTDEVTALLGRGDGSSQPPRPVPAGKAPAGLAVGDVNGDGRLDLVTVNPTSNAVMLLLGNGDGSF